MRPVQQWIVLQAELLRDAVARGDRAAADVLRFADVVPDAQGGHLDLDALIWAAAHDRRPVVEFLLTKGPDLRVTEPCFHATALGAARYLGNDEMAALLEPLTPPT